MGTTGYKFIRDPHHPLTTSWGTVLEHRKVLYDAIGPGAHPCHWCGKELRWTRKKGGGKNALIADHLDCDPANNTPENLVPCCAYCNVNRNRADLITDEETSVSVTGHRGRLRAEELTCPKCGKPFLVPKGDVHRRRYCSNACARRYRPRAYCTMPGCDGPVNGRGLCGKHYARWLRHGDPSYGD